MCTVYTYRVFYGSENASTNKNYRCDDLPGLPKGPHCAGPIARVQKRSEFNREAASMRLPSARRRALHRLLPRPLEDHLRWQRPALSVRGDLRVIVPVAPILSANLLASSVRR